MLTEPEQLFWQQRWPHRPKNLVTGLSFCLQGAGTITSCSSTHPWRTCNSCHSQFFQLQSAPWPVLPWGFCLLPVFHGALAFSHVFLLTAIVPPLLSLLGLPWFPNPREEDLIGLLDYSVLVRQSPTPGLEVQSAKARKPAGQCPQQAFSV